VRSSGSERGGTGGAGGEKGASLSLVGALVYADRPARAGVPRGEQQEARACVTRCLLASPEKAFL